MLCKKLGVQFKVVSYDRNLWSQTLMCVCCFFFFLFERMYNCCLQFFVQAGKFFPFQRNKGPWIWHMLFKIFIFFPFFLRPISASPDVLIDQFWAARLFCGFSEQNQSSCEALGTTVCFSKGKQELFLEIFRHVCRRGFKCSLWCQQRYFGTSSKGRLPLHVQLEAFKCSGCGSLGMRWLFTPVSPGGHDQATLWKINTWVRVCHLCRHWPWGGTGALPSVQSCCSPQPAVDHWWCLHRDFNLLHFPLLQLSF